MVIMVITAAAIALTAIVISIITMVIDKAVMCSRLSVPIVRSRSFVMLLLLLVLMLMLLLMLLLLMLMLLLMLLLMLPGCWMVGAPIAMRSMDWLAFVARILRERSYSYVLWPFLWL